MDTREQIKTCNRCNTDKDVSYFYKLGDTHRNQCIECIKAQGKLYRENNRQKEIERHSIYRNNNPDKIKEINKNYRENNSDKVKEANKCFRNTNSDKIKEQKRLYRKTESFKKQREKNHKKNPHIRACRSLLNNSLRRLGQTKEGKTVDLLGYSALELKQHIESLFTEGMSWSNYGEWHIDHIKPVSSFEKDTHPNIVNDLSNLRPLWATTREINGIIYEGNLNRIISN